MESSQEQTKDHPVEHMGLVRLVGLLTIALGVYWCIAGMVLWWSYDIGPLIRGGYYQRDQALAIVAKMALIITVLTSLVWLFAIRLKVKGSRWRIGLSVGWKTALCLLAYAIIVVARRQLWQPGQGLSDDVMFLPLVGHINGHFFSEAGPLSFVLDVVPIMGCVSGILCALEPRCFGAFDP